MVRTPRVLVTRPEPGASQTAARLDALGFEAVKLPLQETRPLPVDNDAACSKAVAVAFPSASAIRHAPSELLERLAELRCFAVGEATAEAARAAGFRQVTVAGGDAESLAQEIIAGRPAGPVAYLCGKVRRRVFQDRLAQAGIEVVVIETYDTVSLEPEAGVAGGQPVDVVLVYSANAASRLAEAEELADMTADAIFICISERVAETLGTVGSKILVAEEPNESAVLKVLGATVKPAS